MNHQNYNTLFSSDYLVWVIGMVLYNPGRTTNYPEDPPEKDFRFHYLGGGDEVGNVGIILENQKRNKLILDYGLAPTHPPKYPSEAPNVKNAIITHSHVDHIGMAPWLSSNYNTILHGTELTSKISQLMWNDCYKISSIEKYPLPWDKRDIDTAMNSWKTHSFEEAWKQDDWNLSLHKAGHIPGAAMLKVDTPEKKILFTGDFDTRNSPLTYGAKPQEVDTLFIEGTYGGRDHPDLDLETDKFLHHIESIVDKGGTALIPAFANGRTQDIVMKLHKNAPYLDVHVDGMGKTIAKMQMEHPETLRDPIALRKAWSWCKKVSSKSDKKKALESDVIVSTSGMLQGGPSIWYLNRLRHDMKNEILFTGYQAKDTGGRKLQTEGRVDIFGKDTDIPLNWTSYSFSTHAGHKEIVNFVKQCNAKEVVIYHTDPKEARPHLEKELSELGIEVFCPKNGVSYNLEC